jgi:aryl-alcohol dehydrogenase-like predicted oxidoreductase
MSTGTHLLSRRAATGICGGLCASLAYPFIEKAIAQAPLLARPIPHGKGESLPVIGVGTVNVFDVEPRDEGGPAAVVAALVAGGGSLIDTAPSYGMAEKVVGDILGNSGLRSRLFLATKLELYRRGTEAAEARESLMRLKTNRVDLLQLHNVEDPGQDMEELGALKVQGLCRYTGITTTFANAYPAAEVILRRAKPDFLEVDYAIDNREAEKRLLPTAAEVGTAVLVALPFGRGRLLRKTRGKELPIWAADLDCASWGQFFLKFILANPAVTAVIPGTDKPEHMIDNLAAGRGRLPDGKQRAQMVQYLESLP